MNGPSLFGPGARGGTVRPEPRLRHAWNRQASGKYLPLAASVALAAVLFGASLLGLSFGATPGGVSAVWPASGIAIAAVLLGGPRLLPAVAAGALLAALTRGQPAIEGLTAALAATVEAALASLLLRRIGFRDSLRRTSDVVSFVGLAAILSTAVAATIGSLGLLAAGSIDSGAMGGAWRDWWLGDCTGVLVVGAGLLVLANADLRLPRTREGLGLALISTVTAAVSYSLLDARGNLPYLTLPLLFLLAFVYRQRGAAIGAAIVTATTMALTLRGHGPFSGTSLDAEVIRALTFVCVGSVTALLVAAAQSERQLAEQAVDRLAESESALAEAQRLARVGSFDFDLVSGRAIWSREVYRILGRTADELSPGWPAWRQYVHPDDLARVDATVKRLHARVRSGSIVHRLIRPDGRVRTVEVRLRFEFGSGGGAGRVVGTCQDVTAVKLAEERFRALFEHAPYPLVVVDDAGRIALANLRARELFGYGSGELAGCAVEELIPPVAGHEGPWYRGAAAAGPGEELELRGRRRDGSEFPIEVSLTPLMTEEGELVSVAIRDVTHVRAAAETLSFQARHDALTGLPNRMMFLERVEQALARAGRSGRPLAVVFLDLDDFKQVNDSGGHQAGDELLRQLTPRLNAAVRLGDTIARLGGDEFVVLCEDLSDEADAVDIAQRITDAAIEPFTIAGVAHKVSISAGVVMVREPGGVSAHSVLRDADAAMYTAKAGGKDRVAVFDGSMRERLLERVAIEASLRGAVERGELELVYQPVVALAARGLAPEAEGRRVVAVEALLRWRHPLRGLLAPAEFVPVAERSGLIAEIGEWVIEQACRQAAEWRRLSLARRAGGAAVDVVPVSVNVSSFQLARTELAKAVARILRETGLPPELLAFEVTESTLVQDIESSRLQLRRLKELGVRLVVDDFGTGYSSLSALRDLMVDGLKLDRSFVEALGNGGGGGGAMVEAVLGMADALDASLTAEGVETWAQASRLQRHGCGYAQGFLFARPASPETVTELLVSGVSGAEDVASRSAAG